MKITCTEISHRFHFKDYHTYFATITGRKEKPINIWAIEPAIQPTCCWSAVAFYFDFAPFSNQ